LKFIIDFLGDRQFNFSAGESIDTLFSIPQGSVELVGQHRPAELVGQHRPAELVGQHRPAELAGQHRPAAHSLQDPYPILHGICAASIPDIHLKYIETTRCPISSASYHLQGPPKGFKYRSAQQS